METHRVRQEAVYPFHDTRETDERYPEKTLPVIHEQLAKAAVRLAAVLHRAFGATVKATARVGLDLLLEAVLSTSARTSAGRLWTSCLGWMRTCPTTRRTESRR